jgi:hypothetical protein
MGVLLNVHFKGDKNSIIGVFFENFQKNYKNIVFFYLIKNYKNYFNTALENFLNKQPDPRTFNLYNINNELNLNVFITKNKTGSFFFQNFSFNDFS